MPQVLRGHVPAAAARLQAEGELPDDTKLQLAISLPLRDPVGLSNFLAKLYDPAIPSYHHYLTPKEFTERFGAVEKDYQAVAEFAEAHGLHVTARHSNRILLMSRNGQGYRASLARQTADL